MSEAKADVFDFFFTVCDVRELQALTDKLNLVHHAWCYPEPVYGAKVHANYPMGLFTYPTANIQPLSAKGFIPLQTLQPLRVSVHSQLGGMCCSPNNARFSVTPGSKVAWFWSVCVAPTKPQACRACVSLQLMLCSDISGLSASIDRAVTLQDLVLALQTSDVAAAWELPLQSITHLFGLSQGSFDHPSVETVPVTSHGHSEDGRQKKSAHSEPAESCCAGDKVCPMPVLVDLQAMSRAQRKNHKRRLAKQKPPPLEENFSQNLRGDPLVGANGGQPVGAKDV